MFEPSASRSKSEGIASFGVLLMGGLFAVVTLQGTDRS